MTAVVSIAPLVCSGLALWLSTGASHSIPPVTSPTRRVTPAEVRGLQRAHAAEISYCYQKLVRQASEPPPRRTDVVVDLANRGAVTAVNVGGQTPAKLAACLGVFVKSWRFPPDVAAQQVRFPLVFAR